jgi:hypothetical protein
MVDSLNWDPGPGKGTLVQYQSGSTPTAVWYTSLRASVSPGDLKDVARRLTGIIPGTPRRYGEGDVSRYLTTS